MNRAQSSRPGPARRAAAVAVAFLAPVLGLFVLAGPAAAHGGAGTLEVVSTEPQADGASVKVTVQLSFAKDGHPAEDATVTVVGELAGPDGDAAPGFTPVTLTASGPEGQYVGTVPIPGPGTWNLRVTSVEPPATATTQVSVAAVASTGGSPTTTAPDGATTTTQASAGSGQDDGSSSMVPALVAGAVGGAVAAGVAGVVLRRRRSAGQGDAPQG
jgi:hypothetical protein